MRLKKLTAALLAALMLFQSTAPSMAATVGEDVLPVEVYAALTPQSGSCGERVTWTLDANGVLTISGTGPMTDYDGDDTDRTTSYIVLNQDQIITEAITATDDICLDLNGCAVTFEGEGTLDMGEYTLFVMDSGTNAFLTHDGDEAGCIAAVDGVSPVYSPDRGANEGRHYVAIPVMDGDTVTGYEFHRAAASITAVQFYLKHPSAYLSMEGVFRSTQAGLTALSDLGFTIYSGDRVRDQDQMFAANGRDETGSPYEIGSIKSNLANGAMTDPIHYTTQVDLTTDIQARMLFGSHAVPGFLHENILDTLLKLALENLDPVEDEDKIRSINHYLDTAR